LRLKPDYGEAANNLALVLVARDRKDEALALLQGFLEANPGFENTYITLAKLHLQAGRQREGVAVLQRLLERNPSHRIAQELLRQFGPR
jgi:tetratricopeptide (TPR) repeat protein